MSTAEKNSVPLLLLNAWRFGLVRPRGGKENALRDAKRRRNPCESRGCVAECPDLSLVDKESERMEAPGIEPDR